MNPRDKAFRKRVKDLDNFYKKTKGSFVQMKYRNPKADVAAFVAEAIESYRKKPRTRFVK